MKDATFLVVHSLVPDLDGDHTIALIEGKRSIRCLCDSPDQRAHCDSDGHPKSADYAQTRMFGQHPQTQLHVEQGDDGPRPTGG